MATSQARIDANRRNAQKSTGPRTPAGKSQSRRNSFKHGMSADGPVARDDLRAELAGEFQATVGEIGALMQEANPEEIKVVPTGDEILDLTALNGLK